jgi:ABC-type multidrug transport system permease subunit
MKKLLVWAAGAPAAAAASVAWAQSGNMMNGGGWMGDGWMGAYGGVWTPILLAVIVVGAIAWLVTRGGK